MEIIITAEAHIDSMRVAERIITMMVPALGCTPLVDNDDVGFYGALLLRRPYPSALESIIKYDPKQAIIFKDIRDVMDVLRAKALAVDYTAATGNTPLIIILVETK